jgi:iron complex outermembrane receptor protein
MSKAAFLVLLLTVGVLMPGTAAGQTVELAVAGPQPHFVAAWAPKKEREAERSAALAGRVSLELRNVSLDGALKALTNEAGLRITYSRAVLPAGKRVTISANDIAVVTALTEILFRSGLDVVVDQGGALALVACRHPAPKAEIQDSGTIVGTVTDKETGAPIAGATVIVEGTEWNATTRSEGSYRIEGVEAGRHTVRARYIGYATLAVEVIVPEGGEVSADFGLLQSTQKLDELVTVTPGGMQTQVKALPSAITVIRANDIEEQRPETIKDLFRQLVPSAVTFDAPNTPTTTLISLRGASSLQGTSPAKVMVDGVEAVTFGQSPVDPASIERIEVMRGPQAAAVYGADAAGGVIQIFTKRGDPLDARPLVQLDAMAGIAQTPYDGFGEVLRQEYRASIRGGGEDISFNLGGGYKRLGDWVPGGAPSRQTSPSAYGSMGYAKGIVAADVHGRYLRTGHGFLINPEVFSAGFVPFSRPDFADQDFVNEAYGGRIAIAPKDWWRNQLSLGVDRRSLDQVQTERRLTTPADTLFSMLASINRKISVFYNSSATGRVNAEISGSITGGIDYTESIATSSFTASALNTEGTIQTSPPGSFSESRASVRNTGYYAQAQLDWRESVFLTAGLRAETSSTFGEDIGTPVLPRVGLSVVRQFDRLSVKLRGSYGQAIRAPAAGSAVGSVLPFAVTLPNLLLSPERQRGWDAGVDLWFGDRGSLSVTGYDQTAKDLITLLQVPGTTLLTFQFQNLGRVTNSGLEIEGSLNLSPVTLRAQYSYVDSRVESLGASDQPGAEIQVGDRPLRVPTHTAGASLGTSPWAGTSLTLGLVYVGKFRSSDAVARIRCFGGTGPCRPTPRDYVVEFPGFAKINLTVTQRFTRQIRGVLSVDNLTNNTAFEGFNTQPIMGRIMMAGLEARL